MKIHGVLYQGKYIASDNLETIGEQQSKSYSLDVFVRGYDCPRCKKNQGGITIEQGNFYFFCGTQDCLDEDACYSSKNSVVAIQRNIPPTTTFNVGLRFQNACLANWISETKLKEKVLAWMKNPQGFLVYLGCPGCGKTYFSTAVLNYLSDKGEEVYYTNCRRIFQEVQEKISKGQNHYSSIQKFAEKKYLIIDDLGSSTNSEWQKEMILDLIDTRYLSKLPTIITSNLTQKELEIEMSGRTASRINARENLMIQVWDVSHR